MDLYIYYRVRQERTEALQDRVVKMQAALSEQYSVTATLKRRPEINDGLYTWMEIYLAIPEDFERILKRAAEQAELASFIDGERHTEHFLDVYPCA